MNAKKNETKPHCVVGWHSITKIYIHLHISLLNHRYVFF